MHFITAVAGMKSSCVLCVDRIMHDQCGIQLEPLDWYFLIWYMRYDICIIAVLGASDVLHPHIQGVRVPLLR